MMRITSIASLLFCCASAIAQYYPATVLADSVDWEDNITATDRNTYPYAHPSVEITPSHSVPAVYVRGGGPEATISFQEFFGYSYAVTLHVTAARYVTLNNQTHTVTVSPSSQTVNLNAYPTLTDAPVSVSGIPNAVSGGTLEVIAYMTLNTGQYIGLIYYPAGTIVWGSNSTYVPVGELFFTDLAPAGCQEAPWTDLLSYVCLWAEGETGVTDVMTECTRGLYMEIATFYDPTQVYYALDNTSDLDYYLKDWLDDLIVAGVVAMDCRDFAGIAAISASALGYPAYTKRLTADSPFTTNPVCPAGADPAVWDTDNSSFGQYVGFAYHQVMMVGGMTFDASCAHHFDLNGDVYDAPPSAWSLAGYWQTNSSWQSPLHPPFNSDPDSASTTWARLGLAYGSSIDNESALTLYAVDWEIGTLFL